MVIATLFFLGLSVCLFAGLLCFALAKSVKATRAKQPPADEKAAWNQIKEAILDLQSRYETTESPRQKALRSWAGTLLVCAGLCLIGLVIGAEYNNEETSLTTNLINLIEGHRGAAHPPAHRPHNEPQPKDQPASQPTK